MFYLKTPQLSLQPPIKDHCTFQNIFKNEHKSIPFNTIHTQHEISLKISTEILKTKENHVCEKKWIFLQTIADKGLWTVGDEEEKGKRKENRIFLRTIVGTFEKYAAFFKCTYCSFVCVPFSFRIHNRQYENLGLYFSRDDFIEIKRTSRRLFLLCNYERWLHREIGDFKAIFL